MAQWWRSAAGHLRSAEANRTSSLSSLRRSHYHTIQAIPRESTGSKVAARDRMQGRIPAVVFFQNLLDKTPDSRSMSRKHLLTVEKKQIKAVLNSVEAPFFCSTRFPLQIRAGSGSTHLLESGTVLPIKVCGFMVIVYVFVLILEIMIFDFVCLACRFIRIKRMGIF